MTRLAFALSVEMMRVLTNLEWCTLRGYSALSVEMMQVLKNLEWCTLRGYSPFLFED